ncbi:hypothetical protein GQX74_007040 [Glossina fuscipes]|nr:hypothetical protein GQX74_007040 [Glossina fuscipes]
MNMFAYTPPKHVHKCNLIFQLRSYRHQRDTRCACYNNNTRIYTFHSKLSNIVHMHAFTYITLKSHVSAIVSSGIPAKILGTLLLRVFHLRIQCVMYLSIGWLHNFPQILFFVLFFQLAI